MSWILFSDTEDNAKAIWEQHRFTLPFVCFREILERHNPRIDHPTIRIVASTTTHASTTNPHDPR
jgi:hypothetical protein